MVPSNATQTRGEQFSTERGSSERVPSAGPQGLEGVLKAIERPVMAAGTIGRKIETVATLAGRYPLALGLLSLSPFQEAAYRVLCESEPLSSALEQEGGLELVLGVAPCGRPILTPWAEFGAENLVCDSFWITRSDVIAIELAQADLLACEAPWLQQMERALVGWTDVEAQTRAARVAEALDHVDPILLYFDEEKLSNSPNDNNLLKGRGGSDSPQFLLSRLVRDPLREWSRAARTFVYCFDLLLDAGLRGEELNSQYLSPGRLNALFERTAATYRAAAPALSLAAPEAPLAEKARQLKEARAALQQSHRFYRWVHGITLLKEQRVVSRTDVPMFTPRSLPSSVARYLSPFIDPAEHHSCEALMRAFVAGTFHDPSLVSDTLALHPIEALIVHLVEAANEDIASDIGMSRCLRDLSQMVKVHDQDLAEEANGWTQAAYFCAVVPGRALRAQTGEANAELRNVFKAISARMRFNSWHYMPGNFARERCAPDRHFYFPPALPDTAEWSDQRHRGHIAAEVRYSIRSPAPLQIRGRAYQGMLDLRLMRRDGNPYTLAELKRAMAFTTLLQALYQAILDEGIETGTAFPIRSFTNGWFEATDWSTLP